MERRKVLGATGGAIGLGGFAAALAACCGAPWAVGIFGVAGAIVLARLAFLQPYALAAMALMLLAAFWFAYRRPAPEHSACDPAVRRRLRWFVWAGAVVAAILAVAALFPLLFV